MICGAFCGAEHVSWDERWKDGYFNIDNRPMHMKVDLILTGGPG